MLRATLRNVVAHKLRLLLTGLAVVIGVSFVAGTLIFSDTLRTTFHDLVGRTNTDVSVVVREHSDIKVQGFGGDGPPFSQSVVSEVRDVPGVREAAGSVSGTVRLTTADGRQIEPKTAGPPTLVVSWSGSQFGALDFVAGHGPSGPDEIALDKAAADRYGIHVGDTVRVAGKQPEAATVSGIVTVGGSSNLAGAVLGIFDLPTAQHLVDQQGKVDRVDVVAAPGVTEQELATRVAGVLPSGVEAITASQYNDEQSKSIDDALHFITVFLLAFAGIAMFVGSFIILNTFTMLVAQRARELALLRLVGASRGQVTRSVLGEAAIVGVVASTIGLGFGLAVALGLHSMMVALGIGLPAGGLVVKASTVVWAYVVGVVVTVAAAYLPAHRAAKVPPIAALRDTATSPKRIVRTRAAVGGALVVAGVAAMAAGLSRPDGAGSSKLATTGIGAIVVFIGVVALSPFLSGPVVKALSVPFTRLYGTTAKLARSNALRNPRRTASTAAALTIGVTLVTTMSVLATSVKASASSIIDSKLGADYVVSTGALYGEGFPASIADKVRSTPGVATAVEQRFGPAEIDGHGTYLTGLGTDADKLMSFDMVAGSFKAIPDGQLLVDKAAASKHHWQVGDRVKVAFAQADPIELTIGGVFKSELSASQLVTPFVVSVPVFEKGFPQPLDQSIFVLADPGQRDAAYHALTAAVAPYNLKVTGQADYKDQISSSVDQMLNLIFGLLALALVIAVLGIVNTLALSVHERTREIGLLRAVGTSRRQIRRMVRLESVVIAVFGALLGLALGVVFGWALTTSSGDELSEVRYPVGQLVTFVVAAGVVGMLASIWPARRAARLDVLKAVATD